MGKVKCTVLSCKYIPDDKHYVVVVKENRNGMEHDVRFPDKKELGSEVVIKV